MSAPLPDDLYTDDPPSAVADVDTADPTEPDESFWRAYNGHLEFPIATVLSVFSHLMVVAALIGIILMVTNRAKDKTPVPIALVDNGDDLQGRGNPNDGGEPNPIANGDNAPSKEDYIQLPSLQNLPEVKEQIRQDFSVDPSLDNVPLPDDKVAPLASLADDLRRKLMQVGKPKGAGGTGEAGPGGTGSDSTRARSLRWVMRFDIQSGRQYLNQLAAMEAVLIFPIPPANKSAYVYRDLSGNSRGELMSENEWTQLTQKVQFCDYKRDVVEQVTRELRVPVAGGHAFWAFFPTQIEQKLATLEKTYNNKRSEDIEETVFQVLMRGGQYDVVVVRQTLKR